MLAEGDKDIKHILMAIVLFGLLIYAPAQAEENIWMPAVSATGSEASFAGPTMADLAALPSCSEGVWFTGNMTPPDPDSKGGCVADQVMLLSPLPESFPTTYVTSANPLAPNRRYAAYALNCVSQCSGSSSNATGIYGIRGVMTTHSPTVLAGDISYSLYMGLRDANATHY
jgi:hypothetical protein